MILSYNHLVLREKYNDLNDKLNIKFQYVTDLEENINKNILINQKNMRDINLVRDFVQAHIENIKKEEKLNLASSDIKGTYVVYKDEYKKNIETTPVEITEKNTEENVVEIYNDSKLTAQGGINYFNGHKETYYNLDMSGIVSIMRDMGYTEEDYPYWVREDGCKMLGEYIMVAANLDVYSRGSLVETSLGIGIVCDTGSFAKNEPYQIDIAVTW